MFVSQGRLKKTSSRGWTRRGSILVMTAVMLVMIFAFVAFSIDIGYISLTKTKLQSNADAAALAAAQELNGAEDPAKVRANARKAAAEVVMANNTGLNGDATFDSALDVEFGKMSWDGSTYKYQWGDQYSPYNVVRVFGRRGMRDPTSPGGKGKDQRVPMFFAPVLGVNKASVTTSAVASFQARDIMVVLDYSGSMCDDSRLGAINKLGRAAIENNLLTMYQELGSPKYGALTFAPKYAVFTDNSQAKTSVTYMGTSISLDLDASLSSVELKYEDGSTETMSLGLLAKLSQIIGAIFGGSGKNSGKVIVGATITPAGLKKNQKGTYFDFTAPGVEKALLLDLIKYPYPSGNWQEYIDYAMTSGNEVDNAGYRFKFGFMTWINYLQQNRRSYAETPDLWKTSEQPVAILKSAVDEFVDFLNDVQADDKVGLSIYSTNNSAGAVLETGLTHDVNLVKTLARRRQAGHYDPYTNIGAGMKVARLELQNNARHKASKLMIVMTDGVVNRPTNASVGRAFVLSEAQAAAAEKIKIVTISMGAGADPVLMQQVADATGGIHFNVPGGADFEMYKKQMKNVFREIASSRPLKLVRGQ
jgi:hypothetical protein